MDCLNIDILYSRENVFSILSSDHSIYLNDYWYCESETQATESAETAVRRIQNIWKIYKRKKIYRIIKQKLYTFSNQDPKSLLKRADPIEAEIFDKHGCMLVFRLGGADFPPKIYYKIFTSLTIISLFQVSKSKKRKLKFIDNRQSYVNDWKVFYKYSERYSRISIRGNAKRKGFLKRRKNKNAITWIGEMYGIGK